MTIFLCYNICGDSMQYLRVIRIAVLIFPIVSALLSLPFLIYHYRKYGSISFLRFLLIFSFAFYLLCCYFLVILPLPRRSVVANYTSAYYNLKVLFAVPEVLSSGQFSITNPDTYIYLLNGKYSEPLFNILMVIPFGVYLRYYFKCGFFKTLFFSFLLSLFFELTQLSGLYFIYSRPYRLCDVNDLINNTSGGVIGFVISPLLSFFLPSRDKIDSSDYLNGNFVSVLRNAIAVFIDYCIIIFLSFGLFFFDIKYVKLIYLILTFVTFVILPCITSGYTFGKWLLRVRNVGNDIDGSISIIRYFIKWFVLHLVILNGWILLSIIDNRLFNITFQFYIGYFSFVFTFFAYCFICLISKEDIFINKILGISSVSTICLEEE